MFYRKLINSNNIIDFSDGKYSDDCLETEKQIVKAWDGLYYLEDEIPDIPEDIRQANKLAQAKLDRAKAVSEIKVMVDGMVFDGDETSQTRMGRTIAIAQALGIDPSEKRTWVLADNTIAEVTISQLAQALKLAGDEQTKLWTVPYDEQKVEGLGLATVGM